MPLGLERTIVGVPYYDGEGPGVLAACLRNIDDCLNNLKVDAKVVVGINGPRVSKGIPPLSYDINRSLFNANISFIHTAPGIVAAEKEICAVAAEEGVQRIFLTDADITRLPLSLRNMWYGSEKPIIGANYATYPTEILRDFGIRYASDELALMDIFEADKHSLARKFTSQYRPKKRLKGSLILIDSELTGLMFGDQNITSDSVMNRVFSEEDKEVVADAGFMHHARVDITDYIQARMRHFRAAAAENSLDMYAESQLMYSAEDAELIALQIVSAHPNSAEVASNFLLQCALRHQVTKICTEVIRGNNFPDLGEWANGASPNKTVTTFAGAMSQMADILGNVSWQKLHSAVSIGRGVTQDAQPRVPIDLEPFLASEHYKNLILDRLGIERGTPV